MKVEQLYTSCLAQGAYYIESNGEAAVIDPLREVDQYIQMAEDRNAKIKYIFETHFHADFVSGHVDLSKKTGAPIVYGPTEMKTGFEAIIAADGDTFQIGNIQLKLIHTPGHTMESSCYLLINEEGKEEAIFTGDTLFIGDVGRPDLAQHVVEGLTEEKLAGHMFDSLRNKIMPLGDDLIVYPAHGAGSACGKNMSSETSDTLGNQKKTNYALNLELSKEEFIKELTTGLVSPPSYFPENVLMNINGYDQIDDVLEKGTSALDVNEFQTLAEQADVLILDARSEKDFTHSFIPNSIFIGLDGSFAVWVGTLIKDIKQKIIFLADEGKENEVVTRLARVGYDNALGYLKGGIEAWKTAGKSADSIQNVSPNELKEILKNTDTQLVDVRKESEYFSEHVLDAQNVPLDFIHSRLHEMDSHKQNYIHCAGGYRSVIFASILKQNGYDNIINVEGGFDAIKEDNQLELTEYVCPTTML